MLFWFVAGALALAVAGLFALALLRRRAAGLAAADYDVAVYKDQMKEIERDLARGTVTADEAERVRTEVVRRLLDADSEAQEGRDAAPAPAAVSRALAGVLLVAVLGGTVGLYAWLGRPGYADQPLAERVARAEAARSARPGQAEVEAQLGDRLPALSEADPAFLELMAKLRATVAERPDELRGQMLLARNEAALGNHVAAHRAQAAVVALKGEDASAADYADLADLLVLAAGGYVSPEAEKAVTEALAREPRNGAARYYQGLMHLQTGRYDLGFEVWRRLLAESRPQAPWVPPIRAQIEEVAQLAGVRFRLPEAAAGPGPSAADMAAASEMTEEERNEMIRGMVEGLAARLADQGGPAEEWARLIGALGVLDERERAAEIWAEAQKTFASSAEDLATIRAAARQAGVAE